MTKSIDDMSMDEVRSEFKNMLDAVYYGIENLTTETKLARLKNAMGGNVHFHAQGGDETPELELHCLEYSWIMSKF